MKSWWALGLVFNVACLRSTSFQCANDTQCGGGGRCESVGYCSFTDTGCTNGRRFGDLADKFSDTCVGDIVGGDVSIGGMVTNLAGGASLTLRDNNTDDLTIPQNGSFTFSMRLATGSMYAVSIRTQPNGQSCDVTNGTGTATSNVTNVVVSCSATSTAMVKCGTSTCTGVTPVCCLDPTAGTGTCEAVGAACTNTSVPCDSADDCPGGGAVCCEAIQGGSPHVSCSQNSNQCTSQLSGELLCDPSAANPCPGGKSCTKASPLGGAYHLCQ